MSSFDHKTGTVDPIYVNSHWNGILKINPISFPSLNRPPEMLGKTFSQIETVQRSHSESKRFLLFIQRHPSTMSSGTEDAITEKLLGDKVRKK